MCEELELAFMLQNNTHTNNARTLVSDLQSSSTQAAATAPATNLMTVGTAVSLTLLWTR